MNAQNLFITKAECLLDTTCLPAFPRGTKVKPSQYAPSPKPLAIPLLERRTLWNTHEKT